jgi:hypothetical protein
MTHTIPCVCETTVETPSKFGEFRYCQCGYRWLWTVTGWKLYIGVNKPVSEIKSGDVFSGNPKAPCPTLPNYSGATGRGRYLKVGGSGLLNFNGGFYPEANGYVVEDYRRIGTLQDLLS